MEPETANASETQRLLELAVAGDRTSWDQLVTQHVTRLERLLALRLDRRLQGRIDVSDVIQEIYLEAWRHLPQYAKAPTVSFYFWLHGLARNKLCELHRQHLGTKMRDARLEARRIPQPMPPTSSEAISSLLLADDTSPSHAAMKEELQRRILEALDRLDPLDREVLALRHFEQLTPTETAMALEIHEKAAGMRYVRAIRRLKDVLALLPGGLSAVRP
jgi:RNA polymerase sigma-70 factor (ECF subfamily)